MHKPNCFVKSLQIVISWSLYINSLLQLLQVALFLETFMHTN